MKVSNGQYKWIVKQIKSAKNAKYSVRWDGDILHILTNETLPNKKVINVKWRWQTGTADDLSTSLDSIENVEWLDKLRRMVNLTPEMAVPGKLFLWVIVNGEGLSIWDDQMQTVVIGNQKMVILTNEDLSLYAHRAVVFVTYKNNEYHRNPIKPQEDRNVVLATLAQYQNKWWDYPFCIENEEGTILIHTNDFDLEAYSGSRS